MSKKYLLALLLATTAFPQVTMAHFEANHEPFWYVPLHWFIQHYQIVALIGVCLLGIGIYLKKVSEKE